MAIQLSFKKRFFYIIGSMTAVGSIVLLFVSFFLLGSVINDYDFLALKIPDNAPTTEGWVTGYWYWGGALDEKEYYALEYEYLDPDTQQSYYWTSYAPYTKNIGAPVIVEYLPGEPSVSRIKGCTNSLLSPGRLVTGIFLLIVALSALSYSYSERSSKLNTLKNGKVTKGILQKIRVTGYSKGEKTVFRFQFVFTTEKGKRVQFLVRSHRKDQLADEQEELLMYLEKDPKKAVMIDDFPNFIAKEVRSQAEALYLQNHQSTTLG